MQTESFFMPRIEHILLMKGIYAIAFTEAVHSFRVKYN